MKHAFLAVAARASGGKVAALATALVVAGCAGPKTTEHFYALTDGGVVLSAPATAGADPARVLPGVLISAVTVPELVDRPQIVTRDSQNRVNVAEQNLWAEPLRSGVSRIIASRLARTMQGAGKLVEVAAYPQSSITKPYVRVTIDLVRFDAIPNGEAVVDALWSIRRVEENDVRTGRTVVAVPISGDGYEAIVAAWNDALVSVERDIGRSLVSIPLPTKSAVR